MESNYFNKPAYRTTRKKKDCKSDDEHKEQQKGQIYEDVKKGQQNHTLSGRKVRKSRLFF